MSDTQAETTRENAPPDDAEVERVARVNGWKPKDEFKGDPEKWAPAPVFVARGLENPAILADRNKVLASKLDRLELQHRTATAQLETKLNDAVSTVATMTTMMRSAEQRAFERARRELKAERDKAVESGDTQTYQRVDREIEELDKAKPPPEPVVTSPPPPPANTRPPPSQDPAIQRFYAENQWYDPTNSRSDRDMEMMMYADTIHTGLLSTRPDLTMDQNLNFVLNEVKARFPHKFGRSDTRVRSNEHDQTDDDDNGRRAEPTSVSPSGGGAPRRQTGQRRTFDAMPKDSRDAYVKYADQIKRYSEQKGIKEIPLTKEEWARDYWGQSPDDGT